MDLLDHVGVESMLAVADQAFSMSVSAPLSTSTPLR